MSIGLHTSQVGLPVAPELPVLGADRFEILERIGAGGMGTVYKALQKSVGRPVAVKVLSSEYASTPGGVARFVREATVVSRLVHPNIVSMIEFGRDPNGNLLLVMELLEGESLRQLLRREKRLPPWRAVQIAMQVLAALRVAHGAGVIHRDLKPENIFITSVDGADHAKVLDFGVAKMISHEVGQDTTAGSLVGTLKYMSPEQIAGDPPDGRVDLYALGVLLYEMLAGAVPYEHRERVALVRAILNEPPIPIDSRLTGLPAGLADLVMRAIGKFPAERFQSADELRAALVPFAMAGVGARPPVFQITREIRLPSSGALPVALESIPLSDTDRVGPILGEASGPEGRPAEFADPALISGTTNVRGRGARGASGEDVDPALSGPSAAVDPNHTTGAGLTSSTRPPAGPSARRAWVPAVVLGGLFAVGVGLLAARLATSRGGGEPVTGSAREPAIRYTHGTDPGTPSAGANATTVLVRTSPAGAALRDGTSDELLCQSTPCMVPVAAGRQRRVRIALGSARMEVVLDSAIPQLMVPLEEEPTTAPDARATATETEVDATESDPTTLPDAGRAGVRGNGGTGGGRRTNGSGRTNNGRREDPNGGIPMFGVAPGS